VATSGSYNDLLNKPNIAGTYSFNVAADDSSLKTINTNETVKFIGAGSVTTSSDSEGNITITGTSNTPSWGDIRDKNGASGPYSIALGLNANAGTNGVAIGQDSGYYNQGSEALALGFRSGNTNQGASAIALGNNAGNNGQGTRAIAIGDQAGYSNQSANSIILNATGSILNSAGPGFHVAPVRQSLGVVLPIAQYNTSTKELTYSDISINGNTITTTESNVDLVLDANSEGAVSFGSIKIKRNNITGVNSNEDIVIDPSGTGGVVVNGNLTATVAEATTASTASSVGYLGMPQNSKATSYQLIIGDMGKHVYVTATSTVTIPAYTSVDFPIGTTIIVVAGTGATVSIAITTDTMNLAGAGTTGTRTLAPFGMATLVKVAQSTWFISGVGLT
jgi:hypothetical protein